MAPLHTIMIKKIRMTLLLIFGLVLLLPLIGQAAGNTVIGVSTVYQDKVGTVDLAVFIQGSENVASGSFDVEYDSTQLTIVDRDVKEGDILKDSLFSSNGEEAGKVSLAFANAAAGLQNGTLLTFKARVLNAGDTVDLKLANVHFYSADGKEIPIQLIDGQIKPFNGDTKEYAGTVTGDKAWTIKLSKSYNPASLNAYAVTVKRGTVNIDVTVVPKDDRSFTVTPKVNYPRGKYTLEITEQITSANGSKLNKPVRHVFSVQ